MALVPPAVAGVPPAVAGVVPPAVAVVPPAVAGDELLAAAPPLKGFGFQGFQLLSLVVRVDVGALVFVPVMPEPGGISPGTRTAPPAARNMSAAFRGVPCLGTPAFGWAGWLAAATDGATARATTGAPVLGGSAGPAEATSGAASPMPDGVGESSFASRVLGASEPEFCDVGQQRGGVELA